MEPKKSLGQHWLHSDYASEVADAAGLQPGDHVLEVGPGPGNMTEMLLAYGAHVTAVEIDEQLFKQLEKESAAWYGQDTARLELIQGDILEFDLSSLALDYKVVANIPYYLTGKLLRLLTDAANPPATMTLLVQKEVAQRLAARPGQLSIIGVVVQLFGEVRLGEVVPAEAFTPPPQVDSQIVHITRHPIPLFPDLDRTSFLKLVKAGFSEKRKQLRSSLAGGLQMDKPAVDKLLRDAGLPAQARAQELSLGEWHTLWQTLHT